MKTANKSNRLNPLGFERPSNLGSYSLADVFRFISGKKRDEWIRRIAANVGVSELEVWAYLRYSWRGFWAREKQIPPPGKWVWWAILAGRGFGKTRTGAEWIIECAADGHDPIALVGQTAADVRDVMISGPGGILKNSPPWFMPEFNPSMRRLTWPNGVIATMFSGDKPDQLRGPQFARAWVDELAKMYAPGWIKTGKKGSRGEHGGVMDNLEFALRIGPNPCGLITTTPRPIPAIKAMLTDPDVVVVTGSSLENKNNVSNINRVMRRYSGTRLARQELDGEVLDDNPHALWDRSKIDDNRTLNPPDFYRIVVAIDPSGSEDGNECGIIVAGVAHVGGESHLYILDDVSIQGLPSVWASSAIAAYHKWPADLIVAESNFGGAMVGTTLQAVDEDVRFELIHASRGKYVRAEPVSALYSQNRGHHVGVFVVLEDEMCSWQPGMPSPNRLDAAVWAGVSLITGEDDEAWVMGN